MRQALLAAVWCTPVLSCHSVRLDSPVPCGSLGRYRTVRDVDSARHVDLGSCSCIIHVPRLTPAAHARCPFSQAGLEECASRCLDVAPCEYIRGEPRTAAGPGFIDCELLGPCSGGTLQSTGVAGDMAELRSRSCFSRELGPEVAQPGLHVGAMGGGFGVTLFVFALPLCWLYCKRLSKSREAARIAAVALPPLAPAPPSALDRVLHADDHSIHQHLGVQRAASDVSDVPSNPPLSLFFSISLSFPFNCCQVRYASKVATKRRARGLTDGAFAHRAAAESFHVQVRLTIDFPMIFC